jgi:hypothetical protein
MLKRLDTKVNGTKISARYVNRETFIVSKNDGRLSNNHDEGSDDRGQSFQPATERVSFYGDILVVTYCVINSQPAIAGEAPDYGWL